MAEETKYGTVRTAVDDKGQVTLVETTCACGLWAWAGFLNGLPSVMHEQPGCEDFTKRDVLGFLRWLNARRMPQA